MRQKLKGWIEVCQSILTIIAILSAGIWFLWRQEASNKLVASHDVDFIKVSDKFYFANISAVLENKGSTEIEINKIQIVIQRVKPLSSKLISRIEDDIGLLVDGETLIDFPILSNSMIPYKLILRPKESENVNIHAVIPAHVSAILVYMYIPIRGQNLGWKHTSVYSVKEV